MTVSCRIDAKLAHSAAKSVMGATGMPYSLASQGGSKRSCRPSLSSVRTDAARRSAAAANPLRSTGGVVSPGTASRPAAWRPAGCHR